MAVQDIRNRAQILEENQRTTAQQTQGQAGAAGQQGQTPLEPPLPTLEPSPNEQRAQTAESREAVALETAEIIADEVVAFKEARKKLVRFISINISEVALEKAMLEKLKDFLKLHRGVARVEFSVSDHTGKNGTKITTDFEIEPNDTVLAGIEKILGKGVVNFS